MKVNWRKAFKTDRESLLWGSIAAFTAGVLCSYIVITQPKIKDKTDLLFIRGQFKEYTWTRSGRGSYLRFSLQNYKDNFQIIADFYGLLKKKKFRNIPFGDTLIIAIPKIHQKFLNTRKKRLRVFSIEDRQEVYLNYNDTIKRYNSPLIIFAAILFFLIAIFALYRRHKYFPKIPETQKLE